MAMTDKELKDAAVTHLKLTTVGYKNKHWTTPPAGSEWDKALKLLDQIGFTPTPPPSTGVTPKYKCDFETGDLSQVHSTGALQQSSAGRISVTTNETLEGTYSALIKNASQDYPVASGQRTEINFGTIGAFCFGGGSLQGKETWAEWKERLDSGFEITSSGFCIITQFHGGSGSPVFAIEVDAPGVMYCVLRGGSMNSNVRQLTISNSIPKGQTLHFQVYHLWSTSGNGRVVLTLNGSKVVDNTGPNLYSGLESAPYHKGGIYRSSGLTTRESLLLYDDVRWYATNPGW